MDLCANVEDAFVQGPSTPQMLGLSVPSTSRCINKPWHSSLAAEVESPESRTNEASASTRLMSVAMVPGATEQCWVLRATRWMCPSASQVITNC
jgi:hypothetical protein